MKNTPSSFIQGAACYIWKNQNPSRSWWHERKHHPQGATNRLPFRELPTAVYLLGRGQGLPLVTERRPVKKRYGALDNRIPSLVFWISIRRIVRSKHVSNPIFGAMTNRYAVSGSGHNLTAKEQQRKQADSCLSSKVQYLRVAFLDILWLKLHRPNLGAVDREAAGEGGPSGDSSWLSPVWPIIAYGGNYASLITLYR